MIDRYINYKPKKEILFGLFQKRNTKFYFLPIACFGFCTIIIIVWSWLGLKQEFLVSREF